MMGHTCYRKASSHEAKLRSASLSPEACQQKVTGSSRQTLKEASSSKSVFAKFVVILLPVSGTGHAVFGRPFHEDSPARSTRQDTV